MRELARWHELFSINRPERVRTRNADRLVLPFDSEIDDVVRYMSEGTCNEITDSWRVLERSLIYDTRPSSASNLWQFESYDGFVISI